jgi:hypothetical protein
LESAPDSFIRWCVEKDDEQNAMDGESEDDAAKRVQFGRECSTMYTIQLTVADVLLSAGVWLCRHARCAYQPFGWLSPAFEWD